jgi:hypothetical protein
MSYKPSLSVDEQDFATRTEYEGYIEMCDNPDVWGDDGYPEGVEPEKKCVLPIRGVAGAIVEMFKPE